MDRQVDAFEKLTWDRNCKSAEQKFDSLLFNLEMIIDEHGLTMNDDEKTDALLDKLPGIIGHAIQHGMTIGLLKFSNYIEMATYIREKCLDKWSMPLAPEKRSKKRKASGRYNLRSR